MYLINQQTNQDKLYDHDIFIEPALARSLHLRDIQSGPKSQNQQNVNQDDDWKQKRCLDLLHSRKIRIPCASDTSLVSLNFKASEIGLSPLQDQTKQVAVVTPLQIHARKLSLSLNKQPTKVQCPTRLSLDNSSPLSGSADTEALSTPSSLSGLNGTHVHPSKPISQNGLYGAQPHQQTSSPLSRTYTKRQQQPSSSSLRTLQEKQQHQLSSSSPKGTQAIKLQQQSGLSSLSTAEEMKQQQQLSSSSPSRTRGKQQQQSGSSSPYKSQAIQQQQWPPISSRTRELQQQQPPISTRKQQQLQPNSESLLSETQPKKQQKPMSLLIDGLLDSYPGKLGNQKRQSE